MNILLITSEDTGPHLSCYGDPCASTPHLDALAASGARFDNAYVTQAVCSPGRASILTGLYPHQHGQIGLATHKFSMYREFPTIASLLKTAGYRTGRIGKLHVLPETASPFDMVWNPFAAWSFQHRDIGQAAQVAEEFMRAGDEPFFLMMNFPDAHLPWLAQSEGYPRVLLTGDDVRVPPGVGCDSPRLRAFAADYYNCINRLDAGVGMVLEKLEACGKAGETLVIYIADHGPQFSRGKCCITELALRTPLLVRWPGMAQKIARGELVSQIDVLPTICDAANVTPPDGLPGSSLRPLLAGEAAAWRQEIFAEWNTSHPFPAPGLFNPQRAVRDRRYKQIENLIDDAHNPVEEYYTQQALVKSGCTQAEIDAAPAAVRATYERWRHPPALELYDLQEDPWEYSNLAQDANYKSVLDGLLAKLRHWQKSTRDPLADPQKLARFTAEHRAAEKLQGGHKAPEFHWDYLDYFPA
jgi:N-sulfoglucosamine sulfohydrolase